MKIVIVGSGDLGVLAAEVIGRLPEFELVGFLDSDSKRHGQKHHGGSVLGGDDQLPKLRADGVEAAVVAVAQQDARQAVFERIQDTGFALPSLIDPDAYVSAEAHVGDGSCILYGCTISPFAHVGNVVYFGPGVHALHHSHIGDFCTIGSNTVVGARVSLESSVNVGVGSVFASKNGTRVGRGATVGAGAVVVKDIPAGQTVIGNPARPLK